MAINQLKSQNWRFLRTNLLCRTAIPKRIAISQFWFQNIKWHEYQCIGYNFGETQSSNPRVYSVNNNTFCGDTAKIGMMILRQISHILDLSWHTIKFGRRIGGDDYRDIRLVVAKGTLLWHPVKFGGCSQTSPGTTFTLCSGIRQRIRRLRSCFQQIKWQ